MTTQKLSDLPVQDILDYLECPLKAPTVRYLNALIHAYIRKVPWESVSRIVKRRTTLATSDCPRWPEEFWHDAMQYGFGGTCFESNLAFYNVLISLGYQGYLTVNDMGTTRACHAATVLCLNGRKYLVDITIPVHRAAQFSPDKKTRRRTPFHDYTITPLRENVYTVERSHHPQRYAFTLIDVPVNLLDYRSIVENDYRETGFFLKSVVMAKIIDGKSWRFFSDHRPYKLERFSRGSKHETSLHPETMSQELAEVFHMPVNRISAALTWIQGPPITSYTQPVIRPIGLERTML